MRITKSNVDKLPTPAPKNATPTQKRYYDDSIKGFGIRITSGGSKSFFVEKLITGKQRRITIGSYPAITTEQARTEAQKLLGAIAAGIDPTAKKKEAIAKAVTLNEVFSDYLTARKDLKPKTLYDYKQVISRAFADWQNKPLLSLSKDKIEKRHAKLGKERGEAYSNLSMRVLRLLFNFAASKYEDAKGQSLILENPVKRLSQTRSWYRVGRRQTYIKENELSDWYQNVINLNNPIIRDYFLLLLFTGLRRNEAAKLQWQQVDLENKTLTILDPKNRHTHTLPLTDFLLTLLKNLKKHSKTLYVFPGASTSKTPHIVECKRQITKIIEDSGISFCLHDLRRTFITIAEKLDISAYGLKMLLNHRMSGDVTAGYIMADVERLRKPMQQITDYLLKSMGIKKSAEVIKIKDREVVSHG